MSQLNGAHDMSHGISTHEAVQRLRDGEVVAIPTETVYGLAASIEHPEALTSIYTLKGRPKDNPMILHGASIEQLLPFVEGWSDVHQACADAFWPGPLTLILRASERIPSVVTAGLDTVAIRVPNHPLALEILEQTGPLAAPSANLSGKPSATKASHVNDDFGDAVAVVDGDQASIGLESTVVWAVEDTWRILRPGLIGAEEIDQVANITVDDTSARVEATQSEETDQTPLSPGTKYRHYTPKAKVLWLDMKQHTKPEFTNTTSILFITNSEQNHSEIETLKRKNNAVHHHHASTLDLLAKQLYDWFRSADRQDIDIILIEQFKPVTPTDFTLVNRITRAIN